MRLAMPDRAVTGVDVEGARTGITTHYEGRIVETDNRRHIRALRELGCFPINLGGRTRGGYRCGDCGFSSYFARCSRCGFACTKES
jgi:hypothetical protein